MYIRHLPLPPPMLSSPPLLSPLCSPLLPLALSLQLVTSDKGMQPRVLLDVWQQMVDTVVRMLLTLDEKDGD